MGKLGLQILKKNLSVRLVSVTSEYNATVSLFYFAKQVCQYFSGQTNRFCLPSKESRPSNITSLQWSTGRAKVVKRIGKCRTVLEFQGFQRVLKNIIRCCLFPTLSRHHGLPSGTSGRFQN